MREIIGKSGNQITQGSIFNNLKFSSEYQCYGLVLSARCDIENRHIKRAIIAPVISLKDWCIHFLTDIVISGNKKSIFNNTKDLFNKKGLNIDSIKFLQDIEELLEAHNFKMNDRAKIIENLQFLDSSKLENQTEKCMNIMGTKREAFESKLNKLYDNKIKGYFYLENLDAYNNEEEGYVVLINENVSIPLKILEKLVDGILEDDIKNYKEYFEENEISYLLSEIKSPYIEYIIQEYKSFFRVGIKRAENISLGSIFGDKHE